MNLVRYCMVLAVLAGATPQDAGPVEPFDGETLTGWEGDPRFWRVEQGAIVGESTTDKPCLQTTYLAWTGGELSDFDLRLEFRLRGGNSGVQFRSERRDGFQVVGYQADLDAANEWTGGLYEQGGRGVIARRGERVGFDASGLRTAGRLGDAGELLRALRPGDWNEYRVVARGPRIELELNGVRTCELVDRDARFARGAGVLALQLHQGPPMRVEVRDLRLVHLPPQPDAAVVPGPPAAPGPAWIWSHAGAREGAGDGERAWLFRAFELDAAPGSARLEGSCDNGMEVRLNGEPVLVGDDWTRPVLADVTAALREGANTIAVAARNEGGPAGLQLVLRWAGADGVEQQLVTNGTWRAAREAPEGWDADGFRPEALDAACVLGPLGCDPWGSLSEPSAPPRDAALPADEVEVAEGYAVELVYSVPKARYGSWVALTFDAAGRAIASHERGGLYRLTLPEAAGEVELETIDDELGGAQGLLALGPDLYVVAHPRDEHPAGLYRLRDADGDDRYEARELLLELEGSGEHGPHAVVLDPDGEHLVLVAGNHTKLPELAASRVPRVWAEDQLLPRRDDPGGHAVGVLAPGGWVVRTDLDGGSVELYACGLRNAYDVAFGADDELFTYDSDMEWDVGLGWYRPPRVLHLVSGADFGWRHGSGKWPAYWPDTLPSVVDTDLASPTGVLHGSSLTAFDVRERRALFIADWAYGRILAVDLAPRGASWGGELRPFVSGKPLPVTDLAAGPDGTLYFTTGGRGTQSGLYRVRRVRGAEVASLPQPAIGSGSEWNLRAHRRLLEAFHGQGHELDWRNAPPYGSSDPFVRHAARVVLEFQPLEAWSERVRLQVDAGKVQGAIALAHTGDPALARAVSELVADVLRWEHEEQDLIGALRVAGLVEIRLGGAPREQRDALRRRLEALFPSGKDRLDRELCRLLVRLGSRHVVAPAVELLEHAETSEEATHYAFCLIEATWGWNDELRERYLRWIEQAPERYSGGASLRGYLEDLQRDARARFGMEPVEPLEAVVPVELEPRPFVHAWSVADLEGEVGALRRDRSFERGREAFVAARCAECHQVRGSGGRTGPDLTGAGSRYSARDLLEALLEPSKVVPDQYQDTELLTVDDELFVGRVVGESGGELLVLTLPPQEEVVAIPLAEVASRRPHPLSRMPEGLVDVLEREELLDLLAFLLAGGDATDPRFAGEPPTGQDR